MGTSGSPRCPECGQPAEFIYNQVDGQWARCIKGHKWRPDSPPTFTLGVRELIVVGVVALVLALTVFYAVDPAGFATGVVGGLHDWRGAGWAA